MKVSTRNLIQKNADWRRSIVANYVEYLEEAQQYLEQQMQRDQTSPSFAVAPLNAYENIGRAHGLLRHVTNGLRAYFLNEDK